MYGKANVHVFDIDGVPYIYDVGSNEFFSSDSITVDILALWDGSNDDQVLEELGTRYDAAALQENISAIRTAREQDGFFSPAKIKALEMPRSQIAQDRYETGLGHLVLSITERCNLRCRYCTHTAEVPWVRPHRNCDMPLETAIAAIDFFLSRSGKSNTRAITFYGGEPLLAFDTIHACVNHIRRSDPEQTISIRITTNGVLLSDKSISEFVLANGIHLQVSLDGPKEVHDRFRVGQDGRGSYTQIVSGLEKLLDADSTVAERISFISTLSPPVDLPTVFEFFNALPFYRDREIDFRPVVRLNFASLDGVTQIQGWDDPDVSANTSSQYGDALRQYLDAIVDGRAGEMSPALTSLFDDQIIPFYRRRTGPLPTRFKPGGFCLPGIPRLHICANGDFQPCERVGDALVVGSTDEGFDFEAIDDLLEQMETVNFDRCRNCWALRLCRLCYTSLRPEFSTGNAIPVAISESECEIQRRVAERVMKAAVTLAGGGVSAREFLDSKVM